jgi:Rrf2 family protein
MHLNKSTRYALYAAMEMALAGAEPVTVAGVAERYRIPEGALAKVLQQLVRAGIAAGTRGIGGGYRLAMPASKISVQDIINAFEPPRSRAPLSATGTARESDLPAFRLARLLEEVDELVRCTFESVSLETLARGPALKQKLALARSRS